MHAYIRRAVLLAVPAVLASALVTGCSSGDDAKDVATKPTKAAAPAKEEAADEPTEEKPSSAPAPALGVGQTGTFATGKTDDYGENFKVTSKLQVTVVSAKYVTPAEVDTTNEPEQGQYVALTLTFKNVGKAPAEVMTYGMMKWEDSKTAAQDATTLEGVGDGPDLDTTYNPGQSVTGKLILDVARKGGTVSYFDTNGDPEAEGPSFKVALPK
ncbi:DUF4352 domain-containing protein [Streptomyces sp. NPDC059753]|uniref:DUF4352 domain-containing protein n=1 Tax=Streptomyces sp. NPDC059753 TaxID=3346933 RepID=UPI00364CC3DE